MRIYKDWDRQPPKAKPTKNYKMREGVDVHHTVTECKYPKPIKDMTEEAILRVEAAHMRLLQALAFSRGFSDISYNHILFPKTGHVWKGRGFETVGAHNDGENTDRLGIAIVGNFEVDKFPQRGLRALLEYIRFAEDGEHIPERPIVRGHRDDDATACPGKNVYSQLDTVRRLVGGKVA
jgi:hypothetical protein